MPPTKFARETSWDSLQHSEASTEDDYDFANGVEERDEEEPLMTIGEVHRALHPLQATADRVGKQVEQFAESLDRLSPRNEGGAPAEAKDILPLVQEYEKIAADTVKKLKRHHEADRQELLQRSSRRQLLKDDGKSTPSDYYQEETPLDPIQTTVGDLNHWENERQTWQLFGLMLRARSDTTTPQSGFSEALIRPTHTSRPHPYSTEHDVWDYYLEHNPDMWEKHVVVEWLKSNADHAGQDIDTLLEGLKPDTEDSELWLQGWLHSKESIKSYKRLRSWPRPLEPVAPGIDQSRRQATGPEGLITQLDPDAPSRQRRDIAKGDLLSEKATWFAYWEMLRRGYDWESIREWSEQRSEIWQSATMRGDPRIVGGNKATSASTGWRSRTLWRRSCVKLARHGGFSDHERAVYGVLGGELASVRKICRTWDELLFAYYNSQLLQSFDSYVQNHFPERIANSRGFNLEDGTAIGATAMDGAHAWDVLLHADATKDEARAPLKLLQGSLIADRLVRYLAAQASALNVLLSNGDQEARKLAKDMPQNTSEPTAPIQLSDYDLLRILTHVIFVLQDLGHPGANDEGIEQLVTAYLDFLGKAGKQQLLPLYASRLSPSSATLCMARQLPVILDNGERKTMLSLMHSYGMDVPGTLMMQIVLVTRDRLTGPDAPTGYRPLQLLEKPAVGRSAVRPIRQDFIGEEILDDEWDLINGMEWYLLLEGRWAETMYAGSLVYKYLLLNRSYAAARELSRRVPFSTISLNKTEDLLGRSIDLSIFSDEESLPPSPDRRRQRGGKAAPASADPAQRSTLLDEAHTFRSLESLIGALDALESFAAVAAQQSQLGGDARHAKAWKNDMQLAFDGVAAAMDPLLDPSWLSQPVSASEAAELASIRTTCLPELVLAYISVISTCGQVLSREILLRGMDLASIVAGAGDVPASVTTEGDRSPSHRRKSSASNPPDSTSDREELGRCFLRAGRMSELVNALGAVSRLIVQADEKGRKGGRRSGRRSGSEGLGIWNVSGVKGRVQAVEE